MTETAPEGIPVTLEELQDARWALEWADWDRVDIGVAAAQAGNEPPRTSSAYGTASYVTTVRQHSVRLLQAAEAVSRGRETEDDLYDWVISARRDAERLRLQGAHLVDASGHPLPPQAALYDLDFLTSQWAPPAQVMPRPAVNPVALGNPGTGIIHDR